MALLLLKGSCLLSVCPWYKAEIPSRTRAARVLFHALHVLKPLFKPCSVRLLINGCASSHHTNANANLVNGVVSQRIHKCTRPSPCQMLCGIAKDLTKLGGKTVTKLVTPEEKQGRLFKLVSFITGFKNSLKGAGYFLGSILLTVR